MLAPMHHYSAQGGMDLAAIGDINIVQGRERGQGFTWPKRQAA